MFWLVSPQCWSKLLHSSLLSEANVAASGNTMWRRPASCQPPANIHLWPPVSIIMIDMYQEPWHVHCTFINQSFGKLVSGTAAMSATTSSLENGGEGGENGGWGGKKPCPHYQASGRRTLLLIGHFCSTGISALYHTISYYTIQCLSGSVCCKTSTTVHGWHDFKRKYFRLQARSSL